MSSNDNMQIQSSSSQLYGIPRNSVELWSLIFLIQDIVALVIQAVGGATASEEFNTGKNAES